HRSQSRFFGARIKIALEPAMMRILNASVLIGTLAAFDPGALGAQTASPAPSNSSQLPSPPAPVFSIGQPPSWRQQLTAQGTAYSQGDRSGATFSYGVFHSLPRPHMRSRLPSPHSFPSDGDFSCEVRATTRGAPSMKRMMRNTDQAVASPEPSTRATSSRRKP